VENGNSKNIQEKEEALIKLKPGTFIFVTKEMIVLEATNLKQFLNLIEEYNTGYTGESEG